MNKNEVIKLIRKRFYEKGNPCKIPLIKENHFFIATMTDRGIYVDNLSSQPFLPWDVFVESVKLIETQGGKAFKGDAMQSKLGNGKLPFDSIEGYIACNLYGKKVNDSVFRRISPIAGILIWAQICNNQQGYLILNN